MLRLKKNLEIFQNKLEYKDKVIKWEIILKYKSITLPIIRYYKSKLNIQIQRVNLHLMS